MLRHKNILNSGQIETTGDVCDRPEKEICARKKITQVTPGTPPTPSKSCGIGMGRFLSLALPIKSASY